MSKHTPGPWAALITKPKKRKQPSPGTVLVAAGGSLAIDCTSSGDTFEEGEANARLIAAAPEMLEALKMAAWLIHDEIGLSGARMDHEDTKTLDAIRSAIAKAEGRS